MLIPITAGPMLRGMETGGAAGIRGCWLTVAGSGIGNPLKVGTGAAGNWFNTSGLTAGIPLCKDNHKQTHTSTETHAASPSPASSLCYWKHERAGYWLSFKQTFQSKTHYPGLKGTLFNCWRYQRMMMPAGVGTGIYSGLVRLSVSQHSKHCPAKLCWRRSSHKVLQLHCSRFSSLVFKGGWNLEINCQEMTLHW